MAIIKFVLCPTKPKGAKAWMMRTYKKAHHHDESFLTAFMSCVVHNQKKGGVMPKFISKSELDSQKSDKKTIHNVGEIYPEIFSNDGETEFKESMQMEAGIIWLGSYILEGGLFPKEKCPLCGKQEALIPYKAIGSILSGCHTIQYWCKNCGEKLVTNDHIEYFRQIYRYILNNRAEFKPEQKLSNCTEVPIDSEIITISS